MTKKITTFFTDSGTPQTGLSATIRIRNGAGTLVVTDAAMTEVGDGFYAYDFTTYDEEEEYSIRCDGSATLTNDIDRYTYAGNESYMEDVLDAAISDHMTAGTVGAEIMGSGGVVVGGNGSSRAITKAEMEEFAREVWQYMLSKDKNAGDVLLSKSEFNVLKDKVLLKHEMKMEKPIDYTHEFNMVIHTMTEMSNKIQAVMSKPDPKLTIPDSFSKDIAAILVLAKQLSPEAIASSVGRAETTFANVGAELSDKISSLADQMATTNLDLSQAQTLADALMVIKDAISNLITMAALSGGQSGGMERKALKSTLIQLADMKFSNMSSNLRRR